MKFFLISMVCLIGAALAKPGYTKQKRDILPGDPRYGTNYHHEHHETNEVGALYGPPGHVAGPTTNFVQSQPTNQYVPAPAPAPGPSNAYLGPHTHSAPSVPVPTNAYVPVYQPQPAPQPTRVYVPQQPALIDVVHQENHASHGSAGSFEANYGGSSSGSAGVSYGIEAAAPALAYTGGAVVHQQPHRAEEQSQTYHIQITKQVPQQVVQQQYTVPETTFESDAAVHYGGGGSHYEVHGHQDQTQLVGSNGGYVY